jgi:peptide/nickel transport system substrate-binding protein
MKTEDAMRSLLRRWAISTLLLGLWALPAQAQSKDRLVVGMAYFPPSLHPFVNSVLAGTYMLGVSRRVVTGRDGEGKVICRLCTEIPSVTNGRVRKVDLPDGGTGMEVTYTLRPGLKWGDGTSLTTKDIVFGFEMGRTFFPVKNVTGVVALDDLSYVMKLNSVRYDFDRLNPSPVNAAIEKPIFRAANGALDYAAKSTFTRAPETPGLWNGPYLLTEFEPDQRVTFAPNPYWDGEKPAFKQVTMRLAGSTAALQANLLSGDIDIAYGLSIAQALDLKKHYADRFDISVMPAFLIAYLWSQLDNPNLADKRIRQAIVLGIDRQTIVNRLFDGQLPVGTSVLPAIDPSHDKNIKPWPYDPARARELLAQAGYKPGPDGIMVRSDGTRLSLELLAAAGNGDYSLLQQVMQSQLKQIGVEIVPKSEVTKEIWSVTLPHRVFKGFVLGVMDNCPDCIPYSSFGTAGIPRETNGFTGTNYTGYSNPALDAVLTNAVAELDPAKRQVMWNEIQATLAEDLPEIPLYDGGAVLQGPRWMTGLTPIRSPYLPTQWIEYWKPK